MMKYTAIDLNNGLSVAAKILDVTNPASPQAVATVQMQASGINGTYFLFYQAPAGKKYLANMMPYTDPGIWLSPNLNYTPADWSSDDDNGGGGGGGDGSCPTALQVIGFVNDPSFVVGFVNCDCD